MAFVPEQGPWSRAPDGQLMIWDLVDTRFGPGFSPQPLIPHGPFPAMWMIAAVSFLAAVFHRVGTYPVAVSCEAMRRPMMNCDGTIKLDSFPHSNFGPSPVVCHTFFIWKVFSRSGNFENQRFLENLEIYFHIFYVFFFRFSRRRRRLNYNL